MSILFDGTNHPTARQVIAAGCVGALMYGGTPQYAKNFTGAQYRDYKSHGLLTLFTFEVDANDMDGGSGAGAAHAKALIADLRSKGVDEHEPVCATVDKHVAAANLKLAVAYQQGFHDAVKATGWAGRVGGYGFSEFLVAIHDAGIAEWYWGAGSRSSMPPYTNIWQDNTGVINVGGSADDRDWILIPLEGTMDWSDPLANPLYDKAITDPADVRSHPAYTAAQYIQGSWVNTLQVGTTMAAEAASLGKVLALLTTVSTAVAGDAAADSALQAAIATVQSSVTKLGSLSGSFTISGSGVFGQPAPTPPTGGTP